MQFVHANFLTLLVNWTAFLSYTINYNLESEMNECHYVFVFVCVTIQGQPNWMIHTTHPIYFLKIYSAHTSHSSHILNYTLVLLPYSCCTIKFIHLFDIECVAYTFIQSSCIGNQFENGPMIKENISSFWNHFNCIVVVISCS